MQSDENSWISSEPYPADSLGERDAARIYLCSTEEPPPLQELPEPDFYADSLPASGYIRRLGTGFPERHPRLTEKGSSRPLFNVGPLISGSRQESAALCALSSGAETWENDFREISSLQYPTGAATRRDPKDLGDVYEDEGLECHGQKNKDEIQREIGWITLAQASNGAGDRSPSRVDGSKLSYSSTAASEKSDKRKRKSNSSEEEQASVKPYECRFCSMKFTKSQALGGHMNRHRQEREREQLVYARELVMQQGLSSLLMASQSSCPPSLPKFDQAQLQRSPDPSVKYNSPGASVYKDTHSGTYSPSMALSNLTWNLSNLPGGYQNTAAESQKYSNTDDMIPLLQSGLPFGETFSNTMPYMIQHSNREFGQGMQGITYGKDMETGISFDSSAVQMNPSAAAKRIALLYQRHHNELEDAISPGDLENHSNNVVSSARLLHCETPDVRFLSQATSVQTEGPQELNMASVPGFQLTVPNFGSLYSYSDEGILSSTPNNLADFNAANQVDGLQCMFRNQKPATTLSHERCHQDLEMGMKGHDMGLRATELLQIMNEELEASSSIPSN